VGGREFGLEEGFFMHHRYCQFARYIAQICQITTQLRDLRNETMDK